MFLATVFLSTENKRKPGKKKKELEASKVSEQGSNY